MERSEKAENENLERLRLSQIFSGGKCSKHRTNTEPEMRKHTRGTPQEAWTFFKLLKIPSGKLNAWKLNFLNVRSIKCKQKS